MEQAMGSRFGFRRRRHRPDTEDGAPPEQAALPAGSSPADDEAAQRRDDRLVLWLFTAFSLAAGIRSLTVEHLGLPDQVASVVFWIGYLVWAIPRARSLSSPSWKMRPVRWRWVAIRAAVGSGAVLLAVVVLAASL
jgi:hypothetical protein